MIRFAKSLYLPLAYMTLWERLLFPGSRPGVRQRSSLVHLAKGKILTVRLIILLLCSIRLFAQTASVRGLVTDESGAVIPAAKVSLTSAAGQVKTTTAANDGAYSFTGLTPGEYGLQASAPELAMPEPVKVIVRGGTQVLNLQLRVAATA